MTTDNTQAQVTFDLPLINRTGDIGAVLVDLMDTQMRTIRTELQEEFPGGQVSPKALHKIMNSFVSLEGTKQPRRSEELKFPEIPENQVTAILQKLVDGRLLRVNEDEVYELVHDTLAAHLNENRDQDDVAIDETVKMVKDAVYFQEKTNRFLSEIELSQYDKYAETIQATNRLTEEELAFVELSKRKEKRRTLRRRAVFMLTAGVAVLMTVLFINSERIKAENDALATELGLNFEQLKANKDLTLQTAEAIRNSKNDRTSAFIQLRDVQNTSDDTDNQALVGQLTKNFLSEFSLYPFYNRGEQLAETIEEVIVEDSLKFILGAAKDSPAPFFRNLGLDTLKVKNSIREKGFLIDPSEFGKYGQIQDMTVLQDGQNILTGHGDGKIWQWNINSNDPPHLLHHFEQGLIREMTLAGTQLLVAVDSIIYQLNLKQKKPYAQFLVGFNRPIKLLVSNPRLNNQYAVVKENSSQIFLCSIDQGGFDTTIQAGLSTVTSLAFSPDGRKMIAAYEEGDMAKLWSLRRPQIITEFKGHRALISSIAFSSDGRRILTGSWDQTAILWTSKGEIIKRLVGHNQRIRSVAYTKNDFAVTCGEGGNIKTWFLAPLAEQERVFTDSIRALAVSPTEENIAFSLYGDRGVFYLWDWRNDLLDTVFQPLKKYDLKGDIVALAYSEDGQNIVAASENTLTTLINLSDRSKHQEYRGGGRAKIPRTPSISAVDISPKYILIADRRDNQVLLRDRSDLSKFIVLSHPNTVHAAKFSPDHRFVVTGCEDGNAYIWDITTPDSAKKYDRRLRGHTSKVVAVDFSPDGKYVVTGSYDNTTQLYKLSDNKTGDITPDHKLEGITASYRGHTSDINAVTFAHTVDSTYRFVTASADKSGKYWEIEKDGSVHELPSLIRHLDEATVAAFLPGDSLIVTGSFDETLKVWKMKDINGLIDKRVLGRR